MQVRLSLLTHDAASDGVLRSSRGWVKGCGRREAAHRRTVIEGPARVAHGISSVVFSSASGIRHSVRSLPRLPVWHSPQRRSLAGLAVGQPSRRRVDDGVPVGLPAWGSSLRALSYGQPVRFWPLAALPCGQAARWPTLRRLPAFRRLSCHETSILGRDQSLHRPALYLG